MKPTFSVLIPAYNAAGTLADALDSLIAQTRSDWEAIVVDDGSTDATASVAADYASRDPRITVRSQPNGGTGAARNLAAAHAGGRYFSLLDADDRFLQEYFERIGEFIDGHPGYDIYSSDGYTFGSETPRVPDLLHLDSEVRSYSLEEFIVRNRIRVHTTFSREVFDSVGGFNVGRDTQEDWDFWLHAIIKGARHIHDPERLWEYRESATQMSADVLACLRADRTMLTRLAADGALTPEQRRLAQTSRRLTAEQIRNLKADRAREKVIQGLASGDHHGVRRAYLSAAPTYKRRDRYILGLAAMMLSPRLFAVLTRRR